MAPKRQNARETNGRRKAVNEDSRRSRSARPERDEEEDVRRSRSAGRGRRARADGQRNDTSAEPRRARDTRRRGRQASVDMHDYERPDEVFVEPAHEEIQAERDDTEDFVEVEPRPDEPVRRQPVRAATPPIVNVRNDNAQLQQRRPLTRSQSAIHGGLVDPRRMKGPLGDTWFGVWEHISNTLQWARSEPAHQDLMAKLQAKRDREQQRRQRAKEQYQERKRIRMEEQEEAEKRKEYEAKKKAEELRKKKKAAEAKKKNGSRKNSKRSGK